MIQFYSMKRTLPALLLLLALFAALWALSACSPRNGALPLTGAAALRAQVVTPPLPAEDHSEIGSTDGIFAMGVVIAAISILPALMHRKSREGR